MERIFSDMCSGGTYNIIPRDIRSPEHNSQWKGLFMICVQETYIPRDIRSPEQASCLPSATAYTTDLKLTTYTHTQHPIIKSLPQERKSFGIAAIFLVLHKKVHVCIVCMCAVSPVASCSHGQVVRLTV